MCLMSFQSPYCGLTVSYFMSQYPIDLTNTSVGIRVAYGNGGQLCMRSPLQLMSSCNIVLSLQILRASGQEQLYMRYTVTPMLVQGVPV